MENFSEEQPRPEVDDIPEGAEETGKQPAVFISYNRAQDGETALRLYQDLSQKYDVFLDQVSILPSMDWAAVTGAWLEKADYVIALLSEEGARSDFVLAELHKAYTRYKRDKAPAVIPVHINFDGSYEDVRLGAYIGRFHASFWDGEGYIGLLESIKSALDNQTMVRRDSIAVGLDRFLISDSTRERIRETFVGLTELNRASERLREGKLRLLCVVGDAGVRNYAALGLAVGGLAEKVYEVPKSRSWSQTRNSGVSDSVIVFRDALPATHFNEETAGQEIHSLKMLVERSQNVVILTMSDGEFQQLQHELRRYDFRDYGHVALGSHSYGVDAKLKIFRALLDSYYKAGEISKQYAWACALHPAPDKQAPGESEHNLSAAAHRRRAENRENFNRIIQKWLPADIERFVGSLHQVEKPSHLAKLLQRNVALDDEIHSWFVSLDDTTRCFVLSLAIFPDLSSEQLWEKYKVIAHHLRRLDPQLALLPLGICRQRAVPHVSPDGALYFKDERIAEAVIQEIARNYREFFIELVPVLKKMTVPPGRDEEAGANEERKTKAAESKNIRAAIARMVGKVGQQGLDDLLELIEHWATDPLLLVRDAVAVALEQAVAGHTGAEQALRLLEKWCTVETTAGDKPYRAWAAALALASVVSARKDDTWLSSHGLGYLERLSGRGSVRFYVSIATKKMARRIPLPLIESLLTRLAKDSNTSVRINVAGALNEARAFNEPDAWRVLDEWTSSDDENRRWAACCSLVIWEESPHRKGFQVAASGQREKFRELQNLLCQDAPVAKVLIEAVADSYHGETAEETFSRLALDADEESWPKLASGLVELPFRQVDKKLLRLLRVSGHPRLEGRLIEVRAEAWRRLLPKATELLREIGDGFSREETVSESFSALILMLKPEPQGCYSQIVAALADRYAGAQEETAEFLLRLKNLAPSYFAPLHTAVRREALRRLLHEPLSFAQLACQEIESSVEPSELNEVFEPLALPEPQGDREEVSQVLSQVSALDPQSAETLLRFFRTSGSRALGELAYESNYLFVEGKISHPEDLLQLVRGSLASGERENMLHILEALAAPEPWGQRKALARAFVEAKLAEQQGVDEVLEVLSMRTGTPLESLPSDVRRAYYLRRVFVPKFLIRLLTE